MMLSPITQTRPYQYIDSIIAERTYRNRWQPRLKLKKLSQTTMRANLTMRINLSVELIVKGSTIILRLRGPTTLPRASLENRYLHQNKPSLLN